jgi:hypothetical protein
VGGDVGRRQDVGIYGDLVEIARVLLPCVLVGAASERRRAVVNVTALLVPDAALEKLLEVPGSRKRSGGERVN